MTVQLLFRFSHFYRQKSHFELRIQWVAIPLGLMSNNEWCKNKITTSFQLGVKRGCCMCVFQKFKTIIESMTFGFNDAFIFLTRSIYIKNPHAHLKSKAKRKMLALGIQKCILL